jgi:hypothetical protein
MVMANTQVARAAAQLHEAAQDVARVAARRRARWREQTTEPPEQQPPELAEAQDDEALEFFPSSHWSATDD